MAYGEGAYGERSYGGPVGVAGVGAVDGNMFVTEAPDLLTLVLEVPVESISNIADANRLVFVVEIDLGQIF